MSSLGLSTKLEMYWFPSERTKVRLLEPHDLQVVRACTSKRNRPSMSSVDFKLALRNEPYVLAYAVLFMFLLETCA